MPYTPKNGKTEKPGPTLKTAWKLTGIGKMITAQKDLAKEQERQAQKAADKKAGIKRKHPMGKKKKPSKTYHYEYK
jgi:hypothetical protein